MSFCDNSLDNIIKFFPYFTIKEISKNVVFVEGSIEVPNIKNGWVKFKLKCPQFPILKDMQLHVQNNHLMECLTTSSPNIENTWGVKELLENMPKIILSVNSENICSPRPAIYNIYNELLSLYQPEAYSIDHTEDCKIIKFYKFAHHEQHYIKLEVESLKILEHSLPECLALSELLQRCPTPSALLQQFLKLLDELQCFYDNFADIDELCHVMQPSPPTTKHNWRLFPLRERVFIKLIILDPFSPETSMSVQFIGPARDVEELRRTYSEGLQNWDVELDIHKNLLRIFDLCFFPMPPTAMETNSQDEEKTCSICYCYNLDSGEVPVISCDNQRCSLLCHAVCLKQWFNSLSEGKVFLNVSFMECPFCKSEFSTSFAQILHT